MEKKKIKRRAGSICEKKLRKRKQKTGESLLHAVAVST